MTPYKRQLGSDDAVQKRVKMNCGADSEDSTKSEWKTKTHLSVALIAVVGGSGILTCQTVWRRSRVVDA
jgi:hypothetical protein